MFLKFILEMVAWDCYENFCNVLCSDNFIYRFKNYNNGSLAYQTSKITHKSNDIISIERYLLYYFVLSLKIQYIFNREGTHLVKSKFVFDENLCGLLLLTYVSVNKFKIIFFLFLIKRAFMKFHCCLSKLINFNKKVMLGKDKV